MAPGDPDLFAPGIVSTPLYELNAAFTPDGQTVYFTVSPPRRNLNRYAIVVSHYRDGAWTPPEVAPFSGRFADADPLVSPDGKRIYFISNRPHGDKPAGNDYDLWYVEKSGDGWSEPINMGAPINTDKDEFYVSVTRDGTVYYSAVYDGSGGGFDIYRARSQAGVYSAPERLPDGVNSPGPEFDPYIAPDESYLLFSSVREGGLGSADLYISWNRNGEWTTPANLGPRINSKHFEFCPIMSPDGRYFYFTSERVPDTGYPAAAMSKAEMDARWNGIFNGLGNVYRVPVDAIEALKPPAP